MSLDRHRLRSGFLAVSVVVSAALVARRMDTVAAGQAPRQPRPGTFSIVAYDPATGDLGVAVQSKFPCVGSGVPWAKAGVGAVATQALANLTYGPRGLDLLARGKSPEEAIQSLVAGDDLREQRQVGMVDAKGRAFSFTGKECFDWAGHVTGRNFACQGNILVSEKTVQAMARAFEKSAGLLAFRLVAALEAGQAAGGDRRGMESAALLVVRDKAGYGGASDRWIDLRVDDHATPIQELRRLLDVHQFYFGVTSKEAKTPIDAALCREIQGRLAGLGRYKGPVSGEFDAATRRALEDWMGWENLEMRIQPDATIDALVLEHLRKHSPAPPGN